MAIIRMTDEEIDRELRKPEHIKRMRDAFTLDPSGDDPDAPFMTDKQLKEFRRVGRPLSDDPTEVLAVRVPASLKAKLKASGRGAIRKASEYLAEGIRTGAVFL